MSDGGEKAMSVSIWTPVQAAALLVEARQSGHRMADLPEDSSPTDIEQAYAIQDATVRQLGTVGGWKVSPMRLGAPPNCAPIAASLIHASPAHFVYGTASTPEVEVEVAVRLGCDLPPRGTAYEADEMRAAIVSLHPAIEILSSRFTDRKAVSPLTALADIQSNAAVVIGMGLQDWQEVELGRVVMRLRIAGEECAATEGGPDTSNVLAALAWLANHVAARCGGLRAGDVVITGARLGPCAVARRPTEIEADVAGLGIVEIVVA
jgi:2-keto-4-pentenoate hydratase